MEMNNTTDLIEVLRDIYQVLFYGMKITELGYAGVVMLIAAIGAIGSFLFSVIIWILESIPVYKLAKKMGKANAYLAWVPVLSSYFRLYVLADMPSPRPVVLLEGKWSIESRSVSFWACLGIKIFGSALITAIIGILNLFPLIGQLISAFVAFLYLLPVVACAWLEYVYLRDVLDLFKPDRKANNKTALVVTVLDTLATMGFARMICLYMTLKYEPLANENEQ